MPGLVTVLALVLALLVPGAPTDEVLAGLRESPLYVSPAASVTPDRARVREALAGTPVPTYVVVLPQEQVDESELGIDGIMLEVVEELADPEAVVYVVSDEGELQAGEGGSSGVDATGILDQVLAARLDQPFGAATLTEALLDITRLVGEQADPPPLQEAGSTRRTVGLVGLVATGLAAAGLLYARTQRRLRADAPLTDDRDPAASGWH